SYDHQITPGWNNAFDKAIKRIPENGRDLEWFRTVFNKHAHYIKDLSITTGFLYDILSASDISSSCLMLESLTLETPETPVCSNSQWNADVYITPRVWKFICSQRHLKSLTFSSIDSESEKADEMLKDLFLEMPDSIPSLNYLSMEIDSRCKVTFPPNIQEFSGDILTHVVYAPNSNLRRLTISGELDVCEFVEILENSPRLEFLEISGIDSDDDIVPILKTQTSLQELQLYSRYSNASEKFYMIAPLLSNLTKFTGDDLTLEMSESIAVSCKSIQKIHISCREDFAEIHMKEESEDALSPLLTSCRHLKVLDAPYFMLDGKNIPNQSWVCSNLVELHCRVVGFPHFDDDEMENLRKVQEKQENNTTLSEDESIIIRRWGPIIGLKQAFFKQLSMMTSLKGLTVHSDSRISNKGGTITSSIYISKRDGRNYYRYDNPPKDGLTMKLEDGLDQLSTLTQLEYLEFEHLDHKMEKEEIEWIANNLPRLKEIKGLLDGAQFGLEPNLKNRQLCDLMRAIRKDIAHTRRF
ncbi:hypothetical protein BGZ76_004663, partial [Entomortierella beljakovae]